MKGRISFITCVFWSNMRPSRSPPEERLIATKTDTHDRNPLPMFSTGGDVLVLWLHLVSGPWGNTRLCGEEVITMYPVVERTVSSRSLS